MFRGRCAIGSEYMLLIVGFRRCRAQRPFARHETCPQTFAEMCPPLSDDFSVCMGQVRAVLLRGLQSFPAEPGMVCMLLDAEKFSGSQQRLVHHLYEVRVSTAATYHVRSAYAVLSQRC